ncbi:ABC transporter substrate-binding protein [Lysinibacillus fusiformis]|uniref:ABC transporter substrate-binding protein n=1 Tax=Lysinibacillus fusiformis TaxID=28031 RepID=UPI00263B581F|nr:iron-siderophore ABC transporter substrate-binding protein [Lysinibacillus fusiformis]MDC6268276.1 iron-siderophore ABC transporter substrate-binding protein [Lysinibacillus sphaericus]MDN4967234.1 iron-siderophore ABC transporter substrate-binding protein [Lysinibacillus fusiformis]
MGEEKVQKEFQKLLVLLAIVAIFVLAACGNSNDDKKEESSKESNAYSVEHAMGTTEVKDKPKRIVVLTNEGTEALLALGIKPVGAVQSWTGDPWYDHIKDQMEGVEVVGIEHEINLEKIASLKPDLIIGNKLRQEKDYAKLSKIAPTVFSETLRGDWKENFELYAKAVNQESKGKEVLAAYDDKLQALKEKLGDQTNQEVSFVRFMADKSRIYYTDSFSGIIFDALGFKRVPAQADLFKDNAKLGNLAVEVGKEVIPQMDGDVIFYFTYMPTGDDSALATEQEWTQDPLWKNLSAVQKGNAHKVDDVIWNTAGGILAADIMLDQVEEIFAK